MNHFFRTSAALLLLAFGLTACDSSTSGTSDTRISGQVTDNTSSKAGDAAGFVEAAVVTASRVEASGSVSTLSGEATTNAQGTYTLDVDDAPSVIMLTASKTGFTSKVIVVTQGRSSVEAAPMTIETRAEAEAYAEAKREESEPSDEGDVTPADAAFYVSGSAAVGISGSASQAQAAGR
ncbi:MAG TPA: hypothetical protein VD948_00495, partial [Rhodothermales bacterium]|nr:hypothetical protein [Rhodothermales bacterium]